MAARRQGRALFAVVFTFYAAGLLCWLILGLLPTLVANVGVIRHAVDLLATHGGALGDAAERVTHADMTLGAASTSQAVLSYAFSLLNLGLGLILAIRRSGELVPRLLAFALLGTAATFNLPSHRAFHITGSPWPIALIHFTFHITSGVCYFWAVVLFAHGTLPRQIRVSRAVLRTIVVVGTAAVALISWRSSFISHPQFFVVFFGVAIPVAGVSAQALRLIDPATSAEERSNARLLIAALLPALGVAIAWLIAWVVARSAGSAAVGAQRVAERLQDWFPAVFAIVPVVLVAGIVRYRLWDIDRLLSRVLVYGVIAVLVSAVYIAAVATAGYFAEDGLWWTLIALSLLAVLMEPLRALARRWANRVVFGQDLSPSEAMRQLIAGLDHLAPAAELDQLVDIAVRTTRATAAALWLADGGDLSVAACSGAAAAALQRPDDAARTWPVTHHATVLGVLGVSVSDGTSLTAADEAVLADLAAHAGLLAHNALLTVQLARRVEDLSGRTEQLRVLRRRLVTAHDVERRRLERDLHDGAQQALVAAMIGLRTVSVPAGRSIEPTELAELREVLSYADESLREVWSNAVPATVRELGLRGALERAAEVARRSGLDVRLSVNADAEPDPQVAAAIYYCCFEALQNVAKYASVSQVSIEVVAVADELIFAVTDDGRGFDPATLEAGGGLEQLSQRLALVGGDLKVESALGHGTRVVGTVRPGVATASAGST